MAKGTATGATSRRGQLRPGYGYLTCEVAPAPSRDEALLFFERLGGGRVAALVNSSDIRGTIGSSQQGQVIVTVLQKLNGGFLVELPREPINYTAKVPVPENAIKFPS